MENQIEQLKREIRDYELELKKLKAELNILATATPEPKSNHPSDIANAFRIGAIATVTKTKAGRGSPAQATQ